MSIRSFFKPITVRDDLHAILRRFFEMYFRPTMQVYDIGCGTKPFAAALHGKVAAYLGVDMADGFYDASHIDIIGTAYHVPVADQVADAVICAQVIEHLERPTEALYEIARLLKKDGIFILSFPFMYPMHAEPYDFNRFTEFQIQKMLDSAGFDIVTLERIGGFWYMMGICTSIYAQVFDRGILKKTGIAALLLWFIRAAFYGVHGIEGAMFKLFKKDVTTWRRRWTVNYALVARKR